MAERARSMRTAQLGNSNLKLSTTHPARTASQRIDALINKYDGNSFKGTESRGRQWRARFTLKAKVE